MKHKYKSLSQETFFVHIRRFYVSNVLLYKKRDVVYGAVQTECEEVIDLKTKAVLVMCVACINVYTNTVQVARYCVFCVYVYMYYTRDP